LARNVIVNVNVNVYSESSNPKDDYPQDFYIYALDKKRLIKRIINSRVKGH
jgi:hypothetical protein